MFRSIVVFVCLFSGVAFANSVVRMEVQQGVGAPETIDIKLFDQLTPGTVTNFLKYIDDGDYSNSFFHRTAISTTLSIIQGGGFTYDPLLNDGTFSYDIANGLYPGGLQAVPADLPITNEFSKSNTIGTLAMAKLGSDPDSATSQWFINMADNSANLDGQNGGFTVFGEIINNGMGIINAMGAVTTFNKTDVHPAFSEIPLLNYTSGSVARDNLIIANNIQKQLSISTSYEQTIPVIGSSKSPEDVDFGVIILGNTATAIVTITNLSTSTLVIGGMSTSDNLSLPYVISTNGCAFKSLLPDSACDITLEFTPASIGIYDETFNIEFTSLGLSYILDIHGESSFVANTITATPSVIDFGEVLVFDVSRANIPGQIPLQISNQGIDAINIQSFDVSGEFGYTDNCIVNNPIPAGSDCNITVYFGPQSPGDKTGELTMITDAGIKTVSLTGSGSLDSDKVLTSIEDAAPNGGDGNNDGVKDSEQSNVLSLAMTNGGYITIVIGSLQVVDYEFLDSALLVSPPEKIDSAFKFKLENFPFLPSGEPAVVQIGLFLPANYNLPNFYIYGPTADNANPHWYEFMWDGETGAVVLGNAVTESPLGNKVNMKLVQIIFVDGQRGDGDLSKNGSISVQGSAVITPPADSQNGGSLNLMSLLNILFVISLFRLNYLSSKY